MQEEEKMPKIKTHKGTAKVLRKRKNDIKIGVI